MERERGEPGRDPRDRDYETLTTEQKRQIDCVVEIARRDRTKAVKTAGEAEYYAYPQGQDGVAWGVNDGADGCNVKRGLKR